MPDRSPSAPPGRRPARLRLFARGASKPHLRVRAASLAMLGLVGAAVLWQSTRIDTIERQREQHVQRELQARAEIASVRRLASAAGRATRPGGDRLAARRQVEDALARTQFGIEPLLVATAAGRPDGELRAAAARWLVHRQRILEHGRALAASLAEGDGALTATRQAHELIDAFDDAIDVGLKMVAQASALAEADRRQAVADNKLAAWGVIALLVALIAAIGEPTVRAVRRQHRELARRSDESRRLARLAERTSGGIAELDASGNFMWLNPAFARHFEHAAGTPGDVEATYEALAALPLAAALRAAGVSPALLAALKEALAAHRPFAQEFTLRCGRAEQQVVELEVQPIAAGPAGDGAPPCGGFIATLVDRTEEHQRRAVLAHTVDAAGVGTWSWDLAAGTMVCNDRLLRMIGYRPEDFGGSLELWRSWLHPHDRDRWDAAMRVHELDPGVPCHAELRVRRPDGDWAVVQSCGIVTERGPDGRPRRVAGIQIDLTEQVQMQAMLRHAAMTDGLTQMPNRAAVFEHVQRVIDRAAREPGFGYAVLFMDFDRFKQVNDTLGHDAGDELLRQIARRLTGVLRAGDLVLPPSAAAERTAPVGAAASNDPGAAFVDNVDEPVHRAGRIGGDEFVVVLEGVGTREQVSAAAMRMLAALAEPYQIAGSLVHSSASIGIVTSELAANDAGEVMRDADTAMYEAKRGGRGRFAIFDRSMHERVAGSLAIENDLRAALQRVDGQGHNPGPDAEVFVVYQPVVDLHDDGPGGVEALMRWRHPSHGLVPPSVFIPIAEESALIVDLGRWVLRGACRDFVAWQAALGDAAPRSLAVNLSPAQLRWSGLIADVREVLETTGIDPNALQLEVTESLAAQDETARAKLRELKALGVRIALDDFGTGYSSLACLHQLPVDTVKVDRSFVSHAETSAYHRALIEATVRVAQTLGMDTVAEGIETASQAALMRRLLCGRGQGYLFSRPVDAPSLAAWCQRRAPSSVPPRDLGGPLAA